MQPPLIVARGALDSTLRELPAQFRNVLGHPPREPLSFRNLSNPGRVKSYALVGREEDTAIDLRDGQKPIVPVMGTDGRFFLAVGFDWLEVSRRELRFIRLQVLAFLRIDLGRNDEATRATATRQVFRLEWEGTNSDGSFEAVDAAHPHWQIDLLSTRGGAAPPPSIDTAIDLNEALASSGADDNEWLQRMHLAALTDWDGDPWPVPFDDGRHARTPRSIEGLTSWMLSASAYVRQELRR